MIVHRLFGHALLAALLFAGAGSAIAQSAALPLLSPVAVREGAVAVVTVRALIRAANLIPGSVNVQQVAANGQASVLGLLNDSGAAGDVQAGDGIFSGQVVVPAAAEGTLGIRVSFATRGSLRRTLSPVATLGVVAAAAPLTPSMPDLALITPDPSSAAQIISDRVNACFVAGVPFTVIVTAAAAVGATPVGHVADIGNCWQFSLTGGGSSVAAAVATLAARADVQYAEPEYVMRLADSCSPASNLCTELNYTRVLRLAQAHALGEGQGVKIGILDSGIDASVIGGSALFPGMVVGSNFITPGASPVDDTAVGHGTVVAGIVQAAAPQATLLISKVFSASGGGGEAHVGQGLREAALGGAKVVNISAGSSVQSRGMLNLLNLVQQAGIIIVAAVGNDGNSVRQFPAAHVGAIAVGNTDSNDIRHPSSNFGFWVNIAAPGSSLLGNTALTGSSFSAPWVSGTVAMMLAKYGAMTETEVRNQLFRTALPIPANATQDTCPAQPCNQDLGAGRLDPSAALGAIRLTRVTSVGASGAAIMRTIDVNVQNANGTANLFSTQMTFFGQSNGCQVRTVRDPPCIDTIPFDFAALPAGSYRLRLSFPAQPASFFGQAQLTAPGAQFTGVVSGSGGINASDPTRADFSLFGAGTPRTTIFSIVKP